MVVMGLTGRRSLARLVGARGLDWYVLEGGCRVIQEKVVLIFSESDGGLVPVHHVLVQQLPVLQKIARVAVLLGPLQHHLHGDIIELPGIRVRLKALSEFGPQARIVG